jgi:alkyl hydroperoxide reductase subunit AhpC
LYYNKINNLKIQDMATIRLGDAAPDFTAETSQGTINFYDYLGDSWGILFSHPADFTPVCTTELGTAAKFKDEFDKRNVKMIALSVDGAESHAEWIKDINEVEKTTVNFPIIADEDRKVATLYDMIHPNADDKLTVRSVFIIAPDKTVKLILTYPASTGRNFYELLRVVDSLQLTAYHKVATPANWEHGQDVVVSPAIPTEQAREMFTKGVEEVKPYLRMTPDPTA